MLSIVAPQMMAAPKPVLSPFIGRDREFRQLQQSLNDAIAGGGDRLATVAARESEITSKDVIGDILARHPATEPVFRKYYGAACFSCPGQATETIRQSAMMHNADEEQLLRELNDALGGTA